MAETTKITYVSPERLGYYDSKIKEYLEGKDAAIKSELQGLISAEETRAKAAELSNAQAAQAAQNTADAITAKVGEVAEGKTVMGIINEIQENAYDDTELRGLISDLDTNKADKTQVATDIAAAVKAEEDARKEAVAGVQGAVDTLSGTHATDKAALESAIALKADQTALDAVSAVANAAVKQADYDVKVAALEAEDTRIAGLVSAEAERAAGVESGLDERLVEVEAFFKLAEGEQLDTALDTLKELQDFVNGEGAAADQMVLDIAANKKSIEDHIATDHDFAGADAALKSELEGKIALKADASTVSAMDTAYKAAGRIKALEDIDHEAYVAADTALKNELNGEIAKKADTTTVDGIAGRVETAEGEIDALQASLATGGATANAIAEAKKAGTDAQAEVDALEEVVATKAAQADLTAVSGRVTTAEGKVTTLETEMDAVEAKASANETAIGTLNTTVGTKASQTDLNSAVARIETLEAVKHEEITEAAINAWFQA